MKNHNLFNQLFKKFQLFNQSNKSQFKNKKLNKLNQLFKKFQLNKNQLKPNQLNKSQLKEPNKDHQEENTEVQEEDQEKTEVQEKTEAQEKTDHQEKTEVQDNPDLKDKRERREDGIIQTDKDQATSQRIKKQKLNLILILHLKENQLWEISRRRKSDNSKMMDSKWLESQNQKLNKDKRNGMRELTEEKLIIITKTDWLYI